MASTEGGRINAKVKAKALSDLESQCKLGGLGDANGVPGCRLAPADQKTLKSAVM